MVPVFRCEQVHCAQTVVERNFIDKHLIESLKHIFRISFKMCINLHVSHMFDFSTHFSAVEP